MASSAAVQSLNAYSANSIATGNSQGIPLAVYPATPQSPPASCASSASNSNTQNGPVAANPAVQHSSATSAGGSLANINTGTTPLVTPIAPLGPLTASPPSGGNASLSGRQSSSHLQHASTWPQYKTFQTFCTRPSVFLRLEHHLESTMARTMFIR